MGRGRGGWEKQTGKGDLCSEPGKQEVEMCYMTR